MHESKERNKVIRLWKITMSDLIRGGQVSLHKYRMLMQVGKVLFRMSIAIICLSVIISYYRNISANEWKVGFAFVKKEVIGVFNPNYQITYPYKDGPYKYGSNKYGVIKKVSIQHFNADSYVKATLDKFELVLYKSFVVAGVLHILLIGGVLFYFWFKGRVLKANLNIRGIFLINEKLLKKQIKKHNKIFKNYNPFEIADCAYPITGRKESWSAGEQSHTMILGSTGAGKTKIIQHLVFQLHKRQQKAIIVDVKGLY